MTRKLIFLWQDIAAAIDEEDVTKFTDVVKEFDSMTPLVCLFKVVQTLSCNYVMSLVSWMMMPMQERGLRWMILYI